MTSWIAPRRSQRTVFKIAPFEHGLGSNGFRDRPWGRLIEEAGLEVVDPGVEDPNEGEHAVFVARRPR